jgi:prolipoprotein diacylglyceryltransferase
MMLVGTALLISFAVLLWQTNSSWTPAQAANSALIALALGLFGARMEHVILNWEYFADVTSEMMNFAAGGLNTHGAIVGTMLGGWTAARLYRNNFEHWLGAAAYAVCLISVAAWWGCAAASCSYGAEVGNLADYPSWLVWEAQGDFLMVAPRYAVQPIGALASVILMIVIIISNLMGINGRQLAGLALAGVMLICFGLGFLRGDNALLLGNLRATQIMDLVLVGTGVLLAAWPRRQSVSAA